MAAKKSKALGEYQNWYTQRFGHRAPLLDEVVLRGFGHVLYAKIIFALYIHYKDTSTMKEYCEYVFNSWSNVSGVGATVKYFPNWLASASMIKQFQDIKKTKLVKGRNGVGGKTFSDHDYIGQSEDAPMRVKNG